MVICMVILPYKYSFLIILLPSEATDSSKTNFLLKGFLDTSFIWGATDDGFGLNKGS